MLEVNEIFFSIFGEGVNIGLPCVFVRLQGCNCRCNWCDTKYAQEGQGELMNEDEVIEKVMEYKRMTNWVTITGGEPLLQDLHKLLVKLRSEHFYVQVEANGSVEIKDEWLIEHIAMSPKLSSAGSFSVDKMKYGLIKSLRPKDELKFVVSDKNDVTEACELIRKYKPKCSIIFQVEGGLSGGWIFEELSENFSDGMKRIRILPQLHKLFEVK